METFKNIKNTVFRNRPVIFVVTGTQEPFNRMLTIVDQWAGAQNQYTVIAQTARTKYNAKNMYCYKYFAPDDFHQIFMKAEVIIGHAGMGTIIKALKNEKRLVVFPRLVKFKEHRNEHQYYTAKSLEKLGYLNSAFNDKDLLKYLNNIEKINVKQRISNSAQQSLISRISEFIEDLSDGDYKSKLLKASQESSMKIAIIGTRGIPNHYGGFEQFAEYLSAGLAEKGHQIFVYNSHNHPYKKSIWNGVNIIHCFDPEYLIGTAGQFIYDLNCIYNSRKHNFDIILQLGYTSSSIWNRLMPKQSIVVTNMDGLEWKRSKYSKKVQQFLKYAERLAIKYSDYFVSDSIGIQQYLKKKYNVDSTYVSYGAELMDSPNPEVLAEFKLEQYTYDILIARMQPENNIEMILDGFISSNKERKLLVISSLDTRFGKYISAKYNDNRIQYLGFISGIERLHSLRYFSNLYFHGHSVGGTNPSLLEAMASNSLICAHENVFNQSILNTDAYYFTNSEQVSRLIDTVIKVQSNEFVNSNKEKIKTLYCWKKIVDDYHSFFEEIISK